METALDWESAREDGRPCAAEVRATDVNGDGCIDIIDVQKTVALLGGQPSAPEPSQLPYQMFLPQISGDLTDSDATEAAASAGVIIVTNTTDQADTNTSDGICLTASGGCSLRAAIMTANAHSGADTITFAIPGTGTKTIQLSSRLPSLLDESGGTTINGYTQAGATMNSDAVVSNAQIRVEVRGQGTGFDGLAITSPNNVVQGVAFYNLRSALWIYGTNAKDNVIRGDFIGTNAAATFISPLSNLQAHGLHIEQGAPRTQVGGVQPSDRNVISGNPTHGVGLWHWGTNGTLIYNNIIGLSPDGKRQVKNGKQGVDINFASSSNIIGGTATGQRNVISGNGKRGVEISHGEGTVNNQVIGNYIGTDLTGNAGAEYTRNTMNGLQLKDRVRNNLVAHNVIAYNNGAGILLDNYYECCLYNNHIEYNRIGIGINGARLGNKTAGIRIGVAGNSIIGPGNIIAYNPLGIRIEDDNSDNNTITRNSIFGNDNLGIDLAPLQQVNPNDPGDADTGANQQLNFPVISGAHSTDVWGTACADCRVEIFIASLGAGAYGQGKTFVGGGQSASDGKFSITVSTVAKGAFVTATATDGAGNTSEFALNRQVN